MNRKSLALLLVVALLSMMIPSFALAEDPTFEITGGDIVRDLKSSEKNGSYWYDGTHTFKITNLDYGCYVKWTTTDKTVAKVTNDTMYYYGGDVLFGINLYKPGEATITGVVYTKNNEKTALTKEIKVKLNLVKETGIVFAENTPTKINQRSGDNFLNYVSIANADDATYTKNDLFWKVDNEALASITTNGRLTVYEDAPVGSVITITVTAKGDPNLFRSCTVTVTPKADDQPDPEKEYFKSITFSTSEFETSGYLYIDNYYTLEPAIAHNDKLVWTCSDPTVAQYVDNSEYGDPNYIYARNRGTTPITVTFTVKSKYNPAFEAKTIKVTVNPKKPYEKLAFNTTALTLETINEYDDGIDLSGYLETAPLNNDDYPVWNSDNQQFVKMEGSIAYPLKAGTANITVRSNLAPEIKTETALTITVVEPAEAKRISEFSFTQTAVTMKVGDANVDLWDYLIVKPVDWSDDEVVWTSSEPTFATVTGGVVTALRKGTTVITVRSKNNPKAEPKTVTVTVEEADKKPITSIISTQAAITLNLDDAYAVGGIDLKKYLTIEPAGWEDYDDLVWTSSKPQFVTVQNGFIEFSALKPDTATITVRSKQNPAATASISVTLVKDALTKIGFTASTPTEMTLDFDPISLWKFIDTDPAYYVNYYQDEIVFESSDPQVAEVIGGYLCAYKVGTTVITAHAKDDPTVTTAPLTLTVKAIPVTALTFEKDIFTVKVGDWLNVEDVSVSLLYYAKYTPANAGYDNIVFESSDPDIAIVNEKGYVYGVKPGTATVKVTVRNDDGTLVSQTTTVQVVDTTATAIAFNKDAYTVNVGNGGKGKSLYLTVAPADADVDWSEVHAESSDQEIATVYVEEGYVYLWAKQPGTVTVTVTSRENAALVAATTVTVQPIAIQSASFPKKYKELEIPMYDVEAASMYEGQNEVKVHANIVPTDAYYEAKWETSNASVAYVAKTVSNDGSSSDSPNYARIVAAGPGSCKIYLTVTDGTNTITKKIKVTVRKAKVTKLALNKTKATGYIIKGEDNTLQLFATDSNTGFEVPVTWKSSDKKVAKVNKYGLVTFVAAGKATITATTKDGNKTTKDCVLTVKKLDVTSVTPTKKTLTMKVGETATLTAKVKPGKAYNPALYFKSSKPKIVSVDQEGNVTALAVGKAVISIIAKDGTKTTGKVTITVKAGTKNNEGDVLDLTIDGDLMDGLVGIDGLDIGDDVMDIEDAVTNVTIE